MTKKVITHRSATLLVDIRSVYLEWTATLTFALVLILLRSWDLSFKKSGVGVVLGAFGLISYSLYLTHQFNLKTSQIVASALVHLGLWPESAFAIRLIFLCAVASLFWYFCERPFLNAPIPNRPRLSPAK